MGFWSRLFGERETDAQRLDRARTHLDDREPLLALKTVQGLGGPEVDELRRRARDLASSIDARAAERPQRNIHPDANDPLRSRDEPPPRNRGGDPYRDPAKQSKPRKPPKPPKQPPPGEMTIQFGADGSLTIGSGADAITLNAPRSDDDGRPRSTDGLVVAHRLLETNGAQDLDARGFAFVDAAALIAHTGEPMPVQRDPHRQIVAALATAASTREPERVAALIRTAAPEVAEVVAWFATPLAIRFAAAELGALAMQGLVTPTVALVEALLPTDVATCVRLVEQTADPLFAGEARLLADAAGVDTPLSWVDWRQATTPEHERAWRALEIRRLARTDLDAALALEELHAGEVGPDHLATFELARAMAATDPARALAKLAAFEPFVDHAGWLAGLARSRIDGTADVLDTWIDDLGPSTYDPYAYFAEVLAACIDLGDIARVQRCLVRAGPTGWQVACAARDALARSDRKDLVLAACYERVPAGVVAGRAIPFGAMPFAAGKVVIQPAWLAFTEPHPIETLAIVAALGDAGPRWPS